MAFYFVFLMVYAPLTRHATAVNRFYVSVGVCYWLQTFLPPPSPHTKLIQKKRKGKENDMIKYIHVDSSNNEAVFLRTMSIWQCIHFLYRIHLTHFYSQIIHMNSRSLHCSFFSFSFNRIIRNFLQKIDILQFESH